MKILIVTENAYSGGLDSFLATLINSWPYAADELTLVCNANHPGLEVIRQQMRRDCEIIGHEYPLPWSIGDAPTNKLVRVMRFPFRLIGRLILFARYLGIYRRLFNEVQAERLLVVNGGYPAGLTCRAATVAWGMAGREPSSVHNFHNFSQLPRWWEKPFEAIIDRLVHRYAGRIISVSRVCADSLRNRHAFQDSSKLDFIYNGILEREPKRDAVAVKQELGVDPKAPMLLMLGTYEPRKGHEFLLTTFKKVLEKTPEARLVICGFGYPSEIAKVHDRVTALGMDKEVVIEGFRQDVPDLIGACDILVTPSQTDESFGLTIVEAMAQKKPVVATRVGGIPEVLPDGEGGYLVDPHDIEAATARLCELLADDSKRAELGAIGRARFEEKFSAFAMASKYAKLVRAEDPEHRP